MSEQTRRRIVDRKIVEMMMKGIGVNAIARHLHVAKRRIWALRNKAVEHRYLEADGKPGSVALPAYPEVLFPDPVDGRTLRLSESHEWLEPHRDWIREHLEAVWHAVTVFEELPVQGVSRSSFYRFLEGHKFNRLGESYRVFPEIRHAAGEALPLDWGKLRDAPDPITGQPHALWMFIGVLGFSLYMMVRLVWNKCNVWRRCMGIEPTYPESIGTHRF